MGFTQFPIKIDQVGWSLNATHLSGEKKMDGLCAVYRIDLWKI